MLLNYNIFINYQTKKNLKMNSNDLNLEKEENISSQSSIISENQSKKDNIKNKRKNKKKETKEKEGMVLTQKYVNQKSLLSEIKSISIPNSEEGKKELIKTLRINLIEIDNTINLLFKKRNYYNEIINSIEKEFMKKEEKLKKEKIKEEKSNFLINELLSINIIKFYS